MAIKNFIYYAIFIILFNSCSDVKDQDNIKFSLKQDTDSIDVYGCFEPIIQKINDKNKNVFQKCNLSDIKIEEEEIHYNEENVSVNDSSLINWLFLINKERIQLYHLKYKNNNFYLLSSVLTGGSGLSTIFFHWLLIDINTKRSFYLHSFSDRADCFYIDNKSGALHFILFDYAEEWLSSDWNYHHYSFDVVYCLYNNGNYKAINRKTVRCNAYKS